MLEAPWLDLQGSLAADCPQLSLRSGASMRMGSPRAAGGDAKFRQALTSAPNMHVRLSTRVLGHAPSALARLPGPPPGIWGLAAAPKRFEQVIPNAWRRAGALVWAICCGRVHPPPPPAACAA